VPAALQAVLMPSCAPGEWELFRTPAAPGGPIVVRKVYSNLEAVAAAIPPGEPFLLELPLEAGLIQRLTLPPAEPSELEEMARIQLEKILPYPAESFGMAVQVVERRETEVILSVEAVHFDRLLAICQPLMARGCWPSRVTFHAWSLAAGAPDGETSALVFCEAGKTVLGICENGRLSFVQSLGGTSLSPYELARDLPTVLLGAELAGVSVALTSVRLDERCEDLRGALEDSLRLPVHTFSLEPTAEASDGSDLSPKHWQEERLRSARAARFRRRVFIGAALYALMMLAAFVALGMLKFQVSRLNARLRADAPTQKFVQGVEAKWKALAPAVQPSRFMAEVLNQVCECLPPGNIVLTPTALAVQGEAPSPAVAINFSEKLKSRPELKMYRFEPVLPANLPNGHASFSVKGSTN
jgi:hypothetical protein